MGTGIFVKVTRFGFRADRPTGAGPSCESHQYEDEDEVQTLDIFVPKFCLFSHNPSLPTECTSVAVDENDREMDTNGEGDYIDKEEGDDNG